MPRRESAEAAGADDVNAHARVSVARLAKETSVSERSVRRAIADLEAKGLLTRVSLDEFVIHVDALEAMPKVAADA